MKYICYDAKLLYIKKKKKLEAIIYDARITSITVLLVSAGPSIASPFSSESSESEMSSDG